MRIQSGKRFLQAILLTSLVSVPGPSFAQTGGDIAGLIPAPKFLKGAIKDNHYSFPNNDFRIAVPHQEGTEEFRYMQVKEQIFALSTYASFGPAALDRKIFRVEASTILDPSAPRPAIEAMASEAFPAYIAQIEQGYSTPAEQLVFRQTEMKGIKAMFGLYRQQIKPRTRLFGPTIAGETRMHALYLIDAETYGAFFWIEVPDADAGLQESLEKETYGPVIDFVSSLASQRPTP